MIEAVKTYYKRAQAISYAMKYVGTPYLWGGDDPMAGFDCSGFVVEILQAIGCLPHGSDYTADMLWKKFRKYEVNQGSMGCLAFWFKNENASHVELMIDKEFVIGASGGGPNIKTWQDAIKANAFIKMRPVNYRGPNFKIVDPFKSIEET